MSLAAPPPPAELEPATLAYRQQVAARLGQAIDRGVQDFAGLLAAAEGADPLLVAQQLRERYGVELPDPTTPLVRARWSPELHARDFEWYFTTDCARSLAGRAAALGQRILCLGTPTVAFALHEQSRLTRLTLVDRNPLVDRRVPGPSGLETIHADLAAARLDAGRYDLALFDAPWYPAAMQRWLAVAAHAVRPGGRVWFALLPPLHRPGAAHDRARLLSEARRLGSVTVEPGALVYESPHFERLALATAGVQVPEIWRRADLVRLRVQRPVPLDQLAPIPAEPRWARFTLGSLVVHLDLDAPEQPGEVLAPVDARADFRYSSVSTRDPRRDRIGLWTSRSRVARVRRPTLVAALLERLEQTDDRGALAQAPALRSLPPDERHRLLHALQTLLGSE